MGIAAWRRGGLLLLVAALAAGCTTGPPPPKTYGVKGIVKFKDGKPFTNGSVNFRPTSGSGNPAMGELDAEGRFTLFTFHGNTKLPGALEGSYRATVTAKMNEKQEGGWIVDVQTPFTVKPDDDNDFTVVIDPPKGRP